MISVKRDLLGLGVATVLGMAVFASSAQALAPAFLVGGTVVKAGLNARLESRAIGTTTLLFKFLNLEINCNKFVVFEGVLLSATDAKQSILYEECTMLLSNEKLEEVPCAVGPGGDGKIKAEGLLLPAELVDGSPAVLVEKVNVLFELSGVECPLSKDNVLKGELCMRIEGNETVKPILTSGELIQAQCRLRSALEGAEPASGGTVKDKLMWGAQEVFIDGKAEFLLAGAEHEGRTLGVLLN